MGHFAKHCKNKSKDKTTGQVKEVKEVPETGEKDKPQTATANAVVADDGAGDFFNVSVMAGEAEPRVRCPSAAEADFFGMESTSSSLSSRSIPHLVCDKSGRWAPGCVEEHGRVRVRVEVCERPYVDKGWPIPASRGEVELTALADTGAQMCVAGHGFARSLGLRARDLVTPEVRISAADSGGMSLVGAIMVKFTGAGGATSGQVVYIARGVGELFLSKAAC